MRTLAVDPDAPAEPILAEAVGVLREGGVVVYPTETFYGLGADARNASACETIFTLKGRPAEKALPCIVASLPQLESLQVELTREARHLAERFWPGPLTLVVAVEVGFAAASPEGSLAVRVSGLPLARRLAQDLGAPLTATSANRSGSHPLTHVEAIVADLGEGIDLVLDGGPSRGMKPSTILDVRGRIPRLLRSGAVSFEAILAALDDLPTLT